MEKEKAERTSLVEKYGRVQSLMKYVNEDTLKESYSEWMIKFLEHDIADKNFILYIKRCGICTN